MRRGKLVVLLLAGTLVAATVPAGTATASSTTLTEAEVRPHFSAEFLMDLFAQQLS